MAYLIVVVLLVGVVVLIAAPLRSRDQGAEREGEQDSVVRELEAARDAKYREIRDAELDHQTGKLSDEDFQAIDSNLRAEAVSLLKQLDRYHRAG